MLTDGERWRILQGDLTAVGTGTGAWTIGLDAAGCLYVENDRRDFTLATRGAGAAMYGFGPADATALESAESGI